MAYVYKGLNGKNMAEVIATLPEVQAEVDERAFQIGVRAEELLLQHRAEGIAQIEIAKGDIDSYVVLADTNATNRKSNANSAASIEFGRSGYKVEVVDETGKVVDTYEVGPMEGLHILEKAAHLPKKQGPRVRSKTVRIKANRRKRGGGRG
jgi:RecA/RadA recombinase